jgi:hypothetical protein
MLGNAFLNEWGIWICFLPDQNESSDKYNENFMLLYRIHSPSDLAYVWHRSGLNDLDNFLLKNTSTQQTYFFSHSVMKSAVNGEESILYNFSRLALSLSGKTPKIRKGEDSFFQLIRVKRIRTNYTAIFYFS